MAGKYKRYPKYKDSGVEWLGEVPEGWDVTELKRYSSVQGGYAFSSENFVDSGTAVIRIGDIKLDGSVCLDSCKFIQIKVKDNYSQYKITAGDILMAMTGATIGKAGFYTYQNPALLNQRVGSFNCNQTKLSPRFLWFVLNSCGYQRYIKLTAFGGAQPNISDTGMVGCQSVFPLLTEQIQIANFLDHETAKIDDLIEKQELLIKLLKEKRQAVISHAVTKGLNPNAPMKDSGVEWLGEVPEHWGVLSIKHIVSTPITDGPHETPNFYDNGVPFVSAEAVSSGRIDFNKIRGHISEEDNKKYSEKYSPRRGDVYMVKSGATTGVSAIVETDREFNIWSPLAVIRCKSHFEPYFALNFLRSFQFQEAVKLKWSFGTQQNIGMGVIENIAITNPSRPEQIQIAKHLDHETAKIDKLISKANDAIILIKERRTALISAAVTGKIDVRDWQEPTKEVNKIEESA